MSENNGNEAQINDQTNSNFSTIEMQPTNAAEPSPLKTETKAKKKKKDKKNKPEKHFVITAKNKKKKIRKKRPSSCEGKKKRVEKISKISKLASLISVKKLSKSVNIKDLKENAKYGSNLGQIKETEQEYKSGEKEKPKTVFDRLREKKPNTSFKSTVTSQMIINPTENSTLQTQVSEKNKLSLSTSKSELKKYSTIRQNNFSRSLEKIKENKDTARFNRTAAPIKKTFNQENAKTHSPEEKNSSIIIIKKPEIENKETTQSETITKYQQHISLRPIKVRTSYTTERKSMQEIREENSNRIVQFRKNFTERQAQNLKDFHCFYYIIIPGNASYLVKNCMNHRINWKEQFSAITSLFNFKWQQISYGIDFTGLSRLTSFRQIVNHFENHHFISNKANLFQNLFKYCEDRGISVFKYVPFTIIHKVDKEEEKHKEKKEKLKQFISLAEKFVKPYNEIGVTMEKPKENFYDDDEEDNSKVKKNKDNNESEEEKKESDPAKNITMYGDHFSLSFKEKVEKSEKERPKINEKEKKPEKVEVFIGKKTPLEIPSTHSLGKHMWVVKAINLNRGMIIKVCDTFEEIEALIQKIKEGVDRDYTYNTKIDEIPEEKPEGKPEENPKEKPDDKTSTLHLQNKDNNENQPNEDQPNENNQNEEKPKEEKEIYYKNNKIIIQKYIENPLLYYGKKCDMRIWVLVTHKMKVYVFKEGHLKTCSVNYDLTSKLAYTHITNYSFQKHCSNFGQENIGNEVPFADFQQFLDTNYKDKNYTVRGNLMKQIHEIIIHTMRCAKNQINKNNRKFSFEIFGYDFMLDKEFNLFLIEINTNPGLEESSPWIKVIIPRMLDDALRLTVDQVFDTKYDHKLNYKNEENVYVNYIGPGYNSVSGIREGEEKKEEEAKNPEQQEGKYISPFPVPGYTLDENLWEFVVDLNEKDDYELMKEREAEREKEREAQRKRERFTGIKHLMKRKKEKKKTKKTS